MNKWGRFLGGVGLTAVGFVGVLYLWGAVLRPEVPRQRREHPPEKLAAVNALRDVSFESNYTPVMQRDVDYRLKEQGAWYPKGEAPILAELVREGKLPPVAERVGAEPLVLEGVDGIGNYGGTWIRAANTVADVWFISWRMADAPLVRWSPMGYPIRPNIAKGWAVTPDQKVWTFYLRKGIKWSDGHPFSADDIVYWWEQDIKALDRPPPRWMTAGGKVGNIVKVDDWTVQFVFEEPNGVLLESLAALLCYSPRHYLEQYHPKLGNPDLIQAAMKARGMATDRALYGSLSNFRNPEYPRMGAWVYRTYKSSPPESFVRNPYFWAVDPAGNQLPYVDRILVEVKSPKLIPLTAAAGDLTMQERHISDENYTLLMENREKNNYQVYHWFPSSASTWTLWPNINRRVVPEDPSSQWKAKLLANKTFRQALSLSIDRWRIIKAIYNGRGEPAQVDPGRASEFHSEKLLKSFTDFDPASANAMFDQLGLTGRDPEGMRTFPDGTRMTWYIDSCDFTGEGPGQFIVDDWAAAGIRAIQRDRSRPLFYTTKAVLRHDFTVWGSDSDFNPVVMARSFVPTYSESHNAIGYGIWFDKGGLYGNPRAWQGGLEPPPGSPSRRAMELLDQMYRTGDRQEQVKLFREIAELNAEHVWSISIATAPPKLVVVKNGFKNVPRNLLFGTAYASPANAGLETYFFEKPSDSPGALAQIKREMTTITPLPDAVNSKTLAVTGKTGLGRWIGGMLAGIAVLFIVLAGVRHPFIGRRLLIMVPTLLIISLVTFIIIQIPPGDYIQTRILELRQTGDDAAVQEVERLRELFHMDEPVLKQYVRWLGVKWFVTFQPADKGILQGYLGRSMETQREVNDIVGDRIMLTFVVSLGTVLFTWMLAVPVGIYSAVRQYSIGDYVLSFLGFIGMCVPNFLLAILLMYWSGKYFGVNVTGLFSPAYAATPEWTWGKVLDLLQHIWVPVIVIGVGGTAGMIRVMRGNLLDELRKPYVTTAMAKGVRPFRLLMKYPVRLALNPFISGIGGIFPHLVSGGAIVAIVLSLPMVGPVLLQGLMTEDVYLAASMLMVLSLLGVLGTLVSDLLLLWLDPRIRMEGGAK